MDISIGNEIQGREIVFQDLEKETRGDDVRERGAERERDLALALVLERARASRSRRERERERKGFGGVEVL